MKKGLVFINGLVVQRRKYFSFVMLLLICIIRTYSYLLGDTCQWTRDRMQAKFRQVMPRHARDELFEIARGQVLNRNICEVCMNENLAHFLAL
jgi:hypothetical protein